MMLGPRLGDPSRLENGTWWFGYRHARNIPDELFLVAVAAAGGVGDFKWAMRWDVERVLGGLPLDVPIPDDGVPGVPSKVVLAKFRRVQGRGLVDGCDCGCRGDWHLTEKGRQVLIDATRTTQLAT